MARFFVEHREVGWLVLVAVLVWGAFALLGLSQQEDPRISERTALGVSALLAALSVAYVARALRRSALP